MPINTMWQYTELQETDLPAKAQRFIEVMNLDISDLTIALVVADKNGNYIKCFNGSGSSGNNYLPKGQYDRFYKRITLINRIRIGVIIHELTHVYLDNNNYDTRAIGEDFVKRNGENALSLFAQDCIIDATDDVWIQRHRERGFPIDERYFKMKWDEVVCEIVAAYGRRGQFDKIIELFKDAQRVGASE